jgi:hypothetical protein
MERKLREQRRVCGRLRNSCQQRSEENVEVGLSGGMDAGIKMRYFPGFWIIIRSALYMSFLGRVD